MIGRIGQTVSLKSVKSNFSKNSIPANKNVENPIESKAMDSKALNAYYISFGTKTPTTGKKGNVLEGRQRFLEESYTDNAKELVDNASKIAQKYGSSEIDEIHMRKAALESFTEYLNDIEHGTKSYDANQTSFYYVPKFFADSVTPKIITDKKERHQILPIVTEALNKVNAELEQTKKPKLAEPPKKLSEKLINKTWTAVMALNTDNAEPMVNDADFLNALYDGDENLSKNPFKSFVLKLSESIMTDFRPKEEHMPLSIYEDKAKNVLKNLALGTNMFVTYDLTAEPQYMVDTIVDVFENNKLNLENINPQNTQIHTFNDTADQEIIIHKIRQAAQDKSKNHVIVFNMSQSFINSSRTSMDSQGRVQVSIKPEFLKFMEEPPKNVRFIAVDRKLNYINSTTDPTMKIFYENFGEASTPTLSTEQVKKAFREQPALMHGIDKQFSKQAVNKIVEAAAMLEGDYIEKTRGLMKKMATYYVDKKEITESDASKYIEDAKDMFRLTKEGSSVEIIFDTKKRLKDIVGKDATKKEAESFIKQIKSGKMGTKGAIIYSQDGSVGSGRKFTAKAIAGESHSPYVEINALDFGTKETDLFGSGTLSPEASIKKLFSLLGTQAEASPNKSAILYVENFEYFSVGEMVSEYHQKAMSQLLREIENANKKGLNILVLGAVGNPDLIGESTIKSFKFIDKIEVESPSRNIAARKTIIEQQIKKEKLKLTGTEAEVKDLIKLTSSITEHFPHVYLINLVKKMKTVAFERGHKTVTRKDITEAYLQLTTGRPSSSPITPHRKQIVTAHECGHGFNLEFMHMLAEKENKNKPWHLGGSVSFITLDPRGKFGGAMYWQDIENEEHSFEKGFTSGVCSYGGHSAEKHFFNIDGSWGITADIAGATEDAEQAVGIMGQGHNFGKKSLAGMSMKLAETEREAFIADRDCMLKNQRLVSDLITKFGTTFNQEFTQQNWEKAGTGDCLILGDDFRGNIKDWLSRQSPEKHIEHEALDKTILEIIEATKNGKVYNMASKKVPDVIKQLYKTVAYIK